MWQTLSEQPREEIVVAEGLREVGSLDVRSSGDRHDNRILLLRNPTEQACGDHCPLVTRIVAHRSGAFPACDLRRGCLVRSNRPSNRCDDSDSGSDEHQHGNEKYESAAHETLPELRN
jgi:hypothetical protein